MTLSVEMFTGLMRTLSAEKAEKDMRKVRIETNGYGLKVTDEMTGVPIDSVKEVTIRYEAGDGSPTATLLVHNPRVDIVANATITRACPHCSGDVPQALTEEERDKIVAEVFGKMGDAMKTSFK